MAALSLNISEKTDTIECRIDGLLQFSSRDEKLYHELLTLPALAVTDQRTNGWNALVLGGGDGLALRELLRSPLCRSVDLVDYDPEILEHARTTFADLNHRSFFDSRVNVFVEDAFAFCDRIESRYDLIIMDLTFPQSLQDAQFHTVGFYSKLAALLTDQGIFALNSCSPTRNSYAYLSMGKTLAEAGFSTMPMQAVIPSFMAENFGEWGFWLGSKSELPAVDQIAVLLSESAEFVTVSTLKNYATVPAMNDHHALLISRTIKYPADLLQLFNIPQITNPFDGSHGSEQQSETALWTGYLQKFLKSIDLKAFLAAIEKRIHELSDEMKKSFLKFKETIVEFSKNPSIRIPDAEQFFKALLVFVILVNLANPENAFAKGYGGGYHSGGGGDFPITLMTSSRPTPFHSVHLQSYHTSPGSHLGALPNEISSNPLSSPTGESSLFPLGDKLWLGLNGEIYYRHPNSSCTWQVTPTYMILTAPTLTAPIKLNPDQEVYDHVNRVLPVQRKVLGQTIEKLATWVEWSKPAGLLNSQPKREQQELDNLRKIFYSLEMSEQALQNRTIHEQSAEQRYYLYQRLLPGIYKTDRSAVVIDCWEKGVYWIAQNSSGENPPLPYLECGWTFISEAQKFFDPNYATSTTTTSGSGNGY